MKKFIAYLTIGFSILISAFVAIIPTIQIINGNIDYTRSRTYVYTISDRIIDDSFASDMSQDNYDLLSDEEKSDVLDDVVNEFENRLDVAQVNDYKINTVGYDTIEVTFKTESSLYDDVASYLPFSWSFMASTYGSETNLVLGDDAQVTNTNILTDSSASVDYSNFTEENNSESDTRFFNPGDARVEYRNGYPYVVINLSNPDGFKNLYEQASVVESDGDSSSTDSVTTQNKILRSNTSGSTTGTSTGDGSDGTTGEGETTEETVADENKIFILNNWLTNLDLEDFLTDQGTNNIFSYNIRNYVLFAIDCTNAANVYWDYDANANQEEVTYNEIYFGGYNLLNSDEESSYYGSQVTEEALAYKKANIWCGKFNASTYKYEINLANYGGNYAYTESVDPQVEYLVRNHHVQMSSLLITLIVAFIIITLFLGLNYGISGVFGSIVTLGLFILSLGLFNILNIQFNLGAIIALLVITAISIASLTIYFRKIRNEIYLGKNYKKSYQEGGKKSIWYILDISIIGLILGVVTYLVPSSITISFGTLLIIGSVLNFIINGCIVRLISYLLYTSSIVNTHPKLINVDSKFVPNLLNDEKPTYFDIYKTKTTKTTKRIYSIVGAILLVASLAGLITFQSLNGNIYGEDTSNQYSSYVTQRLVANPTDGTDNTINNTILNFQQSLTTITLDEKGENSYFGVDVDNADNIVIDNYYYEYKNSSATYRLYTFSLDFSSVIDANDTTNTYYFMIGNTQESRSSLIDVLNTLSEEYLNATETGELKLNNRVMSDSSNYYVMISILISSLIISVYLTIRFGLAKALTSLILTLGVSVITVGIFSLVQAPLNPLVSYGALFVFVFAYLIINAFFINEKQTFNDNKKELSSNKELKYEKFEYSINETSDGLFITCLVISFAVIPCFFANGLEPLMILMVLIGMVLSFMFIKILSLSLEKKLEKVYLLTRDAIRPKKSKKIKQNIDNDNGPSESIVVGIND